MTEPRGDPAEADRLVGQLAPTLEAVFLGTGENWKKVAAVALRRSYELLIEPTLEATTWLSQDMPEPEPEPAPLGYGSIPLEERKTLAQEFETLLGLAMADASPQQRLAAKRWFYGGAWALFTMVTEGFDAGQDATELDMAYMSMVHDELRQYVSGSDNEEGRG